MLGVSQLSLLHIHLTVTESMLNAPGSESNNVVVSRMRSVTLPVSYLRWSALSAGFPEFARGGMRIRSKGVERSSNQSEWHGLCPWVSTRRQLYGGRSTEGPLVEFGLFSHHNAIWLAPNKSC